ncbi:PQ-loop domain-containing transporter [Clostridium sp. FAM 1755]|uniref:PQ-loop domain-containing transporter n=1 Tax=Clostridium caseinilyticum TaxID=3350403 RepID=UPI0038F6424A
MADLHFWGNIAQALGSFTLIYSFFPQIYKLLKLKNSQGISIQYWTILTLGVICIAINLTISKVNIFIQITQWLNAALALTVLLLSNKYKRKIVGEKTINIYKYYER